MKSAKPRAKPKTKKAPSTEQVQRDLLMSLEDLAQENDLAEFQKTLNKVRLNSVVIHQLIGLSVDGSFYEADDDQDLSMPLFRMIWDHIGPRTTSDHWLTVMEKLKPHTLSDALPVITKYTSAFDLAKNLLRALKSKDQYDEPMDLYEVVKVLDVLAPSMSKSERKTILNTLVLPRAKKLEELVALDGATENALAKKPATPKRKI